jgi:hypothetical protein
LGCCFQYSSGFPVISYYDGVNGDLKLVVCGNTTCTAGNTITTVDSSGDVGLWNSLALNSSGFPVISYHDNTNLDLKLVVCGNTTCTAGNTITTVDSTGYVGQWTSLVLNSSDYPLISYYDVTNGDLKVAICGNTTCTAGNIIFTPDSTGNVGTFTSLTLDNFGFPVISYFDETNGDLKLSVVEVEVVYLPIILKN